MNHIDVEVNDPRHGKWRLTGFYGYPESSRRKSFWNLIRQLSTLSNLLWGIIGDFNDILSASEKIGKTDRAHWLIQGFRDAIQDAGLIDLFMEGYNFTWFKSLGTSRAVEEKLDRALATDSWLAMFPNASLECLTATSSDHYPLKLSCVANRQLSAQGTQFRFENSWLLESEFKPFVQQCWNSCANKTITSKLNLCASEMLNWDKQHGKQTRNEIESVRRKLEAARSQVTVSNFHYFIELHHR